jgi:hypothetical protein
MTTYNVLIMGASYGSLLGTKLQLGRHNIRQTQHKASLPPGNGCGDQQKRRPGALADQGQGGDDRARLANTAGEIVRG